MITEICIAVVGMFGLFCNSSPEVYPIGECTELHDTQLICIVSEDQLMIKSSYYNPELCKDSIENINCFYDESGNSTGKTLGDGTLTEEAFGWALACPKEWYGRVLEIEYAGTWQCRDSGTAIKPNFGKVYLPNEEGAFQYKWYITIDFLLREPEEWNYMLLDWSSIGDDFDNTMYERLEKMPILK